MAGGPSYVEHDDKDKYVEQDDLISEPAANLDLDKENIKNTLGSGSKDKSEDKRLTNELIDYFSQLDAASEAKAPRMIENLVFIINKLCLKRISQEQSRHIVKRYNTTENIRVCVPKCEQTCINYLEVLKSE